MGPAVSGKGFPDTTNNEGGTSSQWGWLAVEQPWLLAVDYILALDGLGLVILRRRVNSFYVPLQGFLQMATGIAGACIQLRDRWDDYGLLWFGLLFVVLSSKWLLHKYLARNGRLLQNIAPTAEYFAPEIYGYLIISMLVYYLHLVETCNVPVWGTIAWYLCFGTSAVLLGTLGGMGLMTFLRGTLIRYSLRIEALVGVAALVAGCFHSVGR